MTGRKLRQAIQGLWITLAISATALAVASPATADGGGAEQWATNCNVPGLDYAAPNSTDKSDDGGAIVVRPDARGRHTPVVMVHGLTGNSKHNNYDENSKQIGSFSKPIDLATFQPTLTPRPSLIGVLQNIRGAAVYTFDYHDYSARWVTDPNIGQSLARAIDCLSRQSGEKVIVVAHSMGGLATREAMAVPGLDIASKVSQVIEFGTPNTGSDIAEFLDKIHAASPVLENGIAGSWLKNQRVLLSLCSADSTISVVAVEKNGCGGDKKVEIFIASLRSQAGLALATGSQELRDLPAMPATIPVHSLSGDVQIENSASRYFRQKYADSVSPLASQAATSMGDQIVSLASSNAGSTTQDTAICRYDFQLDAGSGDFPVMPTIAASTNGAVRDLRELLIVGELRSPCFHGNLMQSITLAAQATRYINTDIKARLAIDLKSVGVPAMCGRPAGTLSNGTLAGQLGQVTNIALSATASPDDEGTVAAALALRCAGGGAVWPDVVALYGHGGKLLGSVDLGRTENGIAAVDSLEVETDKVAVKWTMRIPGAYDPRVSLPFVSKSGTVSWDGRAVKLAQ